MEFYNICYICGYINPEKLVDYSICKCCLYQYGIGDTVYGHESLMEYRNEWIKEGFPFKGILGYFKSIDKKIIYYTKRKLSHIKIFFFCLTQIFFLAKLIIKKNKIRFNFFVRIINYFNCKYYL